MCPIAPCHSSPASSSLTAWPKTWDERTKRMYSLNLRSSAWARRESCNSRLSGRRSFSSSVHLSAMVGAQKNARHWQGQAGTRNPSVETGWRETRVMAVMSGGRFLFLIGEDIRAQQLQKHHARLRDSIRPPTGNRAWLYPAKPCNFIGSAERIDDLVRVHAHIVRHALFQCKPYLTF